MTPTPHIPRRRTVLAGVVTLITIAQVMPVAAHAAPDDALASAAHGQAEAWWQRVPGDRSPRELVFQADRNATPRVIRLPTDGRYTTDLALGSTEDNALAVVLKDRRGLVWARVSGRPRLRRIPGATRADTNPSLLRGRLAYLRDGRSVRLGSLTGLGARAIWTIRDSSYVPWHLALGAGNAVVLVTYLEGAEAASYRAELIRPGTAAEQLGPTLRVSHERASDMWIDRVSSDGRRVTIASSVGDTTRRSAFALPSGRRVAR